MLASQVSNMKYKPKRLGVQGAISFYYHTSPLEIKNLTNSLANLLKKLSNKLLICSSIQKYPSITISDFFRITNIPHFITAYVDKLSDGMDYNLMTKVF